MAFLEVVLPMRDVRSWEGPEMIRGRASKGIRFCCRLTHVAASPIRVGGRASRHSRNCQVYYRSVSIRLPQGDYNFVNSIRGPRGIKKAILSFGNDVRERAQLAKREFEHWLAEADEWARFKDSSDPSIEAIPTQLDWCVETPSIIKNS